MTYDSLGLPRIQGADDLQDSAMFAGLLTVFEINLQIPLMSYLQFPTGYVRHPLEQKYDMSRDQFVCLFAGYWKRGLGAWVEKSWIISKDFISPSVNGHIKRCQGNKASWFEDAWLWLDVAYHALITPLAEPNQLLCMMLVADPKYLLWWKKHNKKWKQSIEDYWCGWRNEPEVALQMISTLEKL